MNRAEGGYVAGAFWSLSPVVVVTSAKDGKVNGQVAVTVVNASIVHSHPRLIVGIWKRNYTHSFITSSRSLAVHLLRRDQLEVVRRFGFYTGREMDKFEGLEHFTRETGSPLLADAHSWIEGVVINAMDGGDMTAFLVDVVGGGVNSGGEWMTLHSFYSDAPAEWLTQYESRLRESVEYSLGVIDKIDYTPWRP